MAALAVNPSPTFETSEVYPARLPGEIVLPEDEQGWVRATGFGTPFPRGHRMYRLVDFPTHSEITCHAPTAANLQRGILERIFFVDYKDGQGLRHPIKPVRKAFDMVQDEIDLICQNTPSVTRMSVDEFLHTLRNDAPKRRVYERAHESLKLHPLTKHDAYLKTFGKREKHNVTLKPNPAQRVIQPRDPRYGLELGRFMKRLEPVLVKGIKKAWGFYCSDGKLAPVVFKGMNALTQGQHLKRIWDSFSNPVAIPTDLKRMDQHVSIMALEMEHRVYMRCVQFSSRRERKLLLRLLRWQRVNRGKWRTRDGRGCYECRGRRCSGDFNTGCGNCLIVCTLMMAFRNFLGIRMAFVNNGDDGLSIMEGKDAAAYLAHVRGFWSLFGFCMQVDEVVSDLHRVSFCQTSPVFDGANWLMCRDPRRALPRDMCTVNHVESEKVWRSLLWASGCGGEALAGHLPLYCALYRKYKEYGRATRINYNRFGRDGQWYLAQGLGYKISEPTPEARVSFWRSFGVPPDAQVAIEREIACSTMAFKTIKQGQHKSKPLACILEAQM